MRPWLLLAGLPLAGCGVTDDRRDAGGVVASFYDAVRGDDAAAACSRLTEAAQDALEPSCEARVTELELEGGAVVRVEVAALAAVATLRSGEQAFLSRGTAGWQITAAGCAGATRRTPATCEVEA